MPLPTAQQANLQAVVHNISLKLSVKQGSMYLQGFPHLVVVERWPETSKQACLAL